MTDVKQPTITSAALPPAQRPDAVTASPAKPVEPTPEAQIVAKPLRAPNFINLRPKNPNLTGYWGNRAVGEKESGMRYDQLISLGFKPAKPDEVVQADGSACPPSLNRDGRILYGDLIFLLIPREDYIGALKWNAESAQRRVQRFGQTMNDGQPESALGDITRSKEARAGKVAVFIPNQTELDSKTADNSGPKSL